MTLGDKWTEQMGSANREETEKILDEYVQAGGNFIDTANVYQAGTSEQWLGDWMAKRQIREELVIATKYSLPSRMSSTSKVFPFPVPKDRDNQICVNFSGNHRKAMFFSVEESLKRLQTHYIDLLYLHVWDWTTPIDEILRAFDDLVRSGKVNYIAVSDTPGWAVSHAQAIAQLRGWPQFLAYQGRYHLGDRTLEREILPMSRYLDIGVVPWGVLGQGKWTGKYAAGPGKDPSSMARINQSMSEQDWKIAAEVHRVAQELGRTDTQVAASWGLSQPGIVSPVIGVRTAEQLRDLIKSLEVELSQDQLQRLNDVSKIPPNFPYDFCGTSVATGRAQVTGTIWTESGK